MWTRRALMTALTVARSVSAPAQTSPAASGPGSSQAFALGIKGIYCWIRDPFLLSGFLLLWLTPFMTENMLPVYLLATVYLFLGSMHWESRLAHQFGEEYAAYKKEVRRMIPGRRWRECRGRGGSELN